MDEGPSVEERLCFPGRNLNVRVLPHHQDGLESRSPANCRLRRGTLGSDRVMLALYDFYPSKEDLLGEAMAGWTIVATFLLLMTLVW